MKQGNVVMLLILAGIISVVAALWSRLGYGLEPASKWEKVNRSGKRFFNSFNDSPRHRGHHIHDENASPKINISGMNPCLAIS
jgi:hypothetical protein